MKIRILALCIILCNSCSTHLLVASPATMQTLAPDTGSVQALTMFQTPSLTLTTGCPRG